MPLFTQTTQEKTRLFHRARAVPPGAPAPAAAGPAAAAAAPAASSASSAPAASPAPLAARGVLLWRAGAAAAGCLLGAGQVYGGAAPFGLALVLGCTPSLALPAAVGVLAGAFAFQPLVLALKLAGAVVAALAGRMGAAQLPGRPYIVGAGAAGAALLAEQVAVMAAGRTTPAETALAAVTGLGAAGLGLALHKLPPGRPGALCLWLAMAAACAQRFPLFGGLGAGLALAACGGLATALAGSLEQSAVLALALAGAVTAATPAASYAALAVALGTLGAAVLAPGERRRGAGVFFSGCAVGALAAPGWPQALWLLAAAGGGGLAALACPGAWLRAVVPPPAPPAVSQSLSGAARRLSGVADALSDIADTVNEVCARQLPPKGENYDFVVEYAARHVCQTCERRSLCWVRGYSTAVDGLYRLRAALEAHGRAELEDLPGQLSVCTHPSDLCAAVTHGYRLWCSRRQTRARAGALRSALTEQYSAMAAALAQMAAKLGAAGLPDARRQARVAQLFAALGLDPLECSVTADAAGRLTANVTVPRVSFSAGEAAALTKEVGEACRRDFALPDIAHCRTVTMLRFSERPLFAPVFGLASRPAPGQSVSGDACDQFCDRAGRAQMLLCDGMGTGKSAAVDGRMAARLTGQLLRAGFAAESAARLVNVALGLKNAEQESGATIDLLTVDLYTGRAGLFKAGAAASFLVRGGVAQVLEAPSLPIGVTEGVVGRSTAFGLAAGDMVVLVSDGALCDGCDWVADQLQLSARLGQTPAQTANAVADSAQRRAGNKQDDITVAVLQLEGA